MKCLFAVLIIAGFVAATGVAQQSPASQHVSHGDSQSAAYGQSNTTAASTKKNSKHQKKSSKKKKKQKATGQPQ